MDNVAQFSATLIPVTLKSGAVFVGHNSGLWPALRLGFKSLMFRSFPLTDRTYLAASVEKEMRSLQFGELARAVCRTRPTLELQLHQFMYKGNAVVGATRYFAEKGFKYR
eukprot:TRINITY_DN4439_c0_g1_i3.p1 TRINITY_DN4439_c0_g1~~TRINITY_DN4439_c0_g1_i3.p1  ORF type:complete len:110 (-),score=9.91 TRINITY_DN4439_c0_g1_i3:112-441(-)